MQRGVYDIRVFFSRLVDLILDLFIGFEVSLAGGLIQRIIYYLGRVQ